MLDIVTYTRKYRYTSIDISSRVFRQMSFIFLAISTQVYSQCSSHAVWFGLTTESRDLGYICANLNPRLYSFGRGCKVGFHDGDHCHICP